MKKFKNKNNREHIEKIYKITKNKPLLCRLTQISYRIKNPSAYFLVKLGDSY